jgi:hypothetical protein
MPGILANRGSALPLVRPFGDGERVFVGGHSWYGPRSFDFVVLAYEA